MGFTVTVPVPPSTNNLYGVGKGGRRFLKRHVRKWRDDAGFMAIRSRPKKVTGPFRLMLNVPKGRKDADNMLKSALDLVVSMGLTPDDKHCVKAAVSIVPELDGYATIHVEEV